MIKKLLHSKTKTISAAALIVGVANFISYGLAALRDNLLANFLPNKLADVYWAAFRAPDFIYGIIITGGITAAFLPVFSAHFRQSPTKAKNLFKDIQTIFFLALVFLSFVFFLLAPCLVSLIAPGFSAIQKQQTVDLMRIMFLSPIFLGLSAIFSAVLQYLDLFYCFAIAPVFYNIGILLGIIFLYPIFGLNGLALGVILGASLHLLIQMLPAIKTGFGPSFSLRFKEKAGLLSVFRLMVPRVVSSAATQINLIVITAIASTLMAGSIKIFNLSNNLYCAPVGLVGLSFASAVFPALSKSFANEQKEKFKETFSLTLSRIVFFVLPISALLFILRAQIVRLLYGTQLANGGYFGWWETRLTASSLGVLSLSLLAACLIPFLGRAFFATHNTKTPLKIALLSIGLNIGLAFLFVHLLKAPGIFRDWLVEFLKLKNIKDISVLGLSLALSISAVFQFVLLLFFLKKKLGCLGLKKYKKGLLKMALASLLASLVAYLALKTFGLFLPTYKVLGLLAQTLIAGVLGVVVYLLACSFMKMKEPTIIFHHFCKIFSITALRVPRTSRHSERRR